MCLCSRFYSSPFFFSFVCVCVQLCLTLRDPMDYSPPGSSVHRIFQARILEWVAVFSPGDLPNPGLEPMSPVSPALQADDLPLVHQGSTCSILGTLNVLTYLTT